MIKAIIFDMDGVLIDARDWHYQALNKALSLFGFEINRFEHLMAFDGLPTKTKLSMLSSKEGLPSNLHQFINELKQKYTMELVHTQCCPRFAHEFALSTLHRQGYRLAVASNSIRHTVDVMLEKAALLPYLEFTLSNEDVNKPKPDPEIYSTAISRLGLSPKECLIVEDNENGVKAAIASGAHVLQVADVDEVNMQNIMGKITQLEGRG